MVRITLQKIRKRVRNIRGSGRTKAFCPEPEGLLRASVSTDRIPEKVFRTLSGQEACKKNKRVKQ